MNQETNLDKALEAIRNGEFVLVFDDDDREGEVDMIIASEFVTPKSIATMRNDAGGLICNCLHADFCDAIHLPFMVDIMKAAAEKYPELAEYELIAMFPIGYAADDAEPAPGHTNKNERTEMVKYL